jgi:hypothetical protein
MRSAARLKEKSSATAIKQRTGRAFKSMVISVRRPKPG